MNLSSIARNTSCALTAGFALLSLVASFWFLIAGEIRNPQFGVAVVALLPVTLSAGVLWTAFLAFRRQRAAFLLPVWAFAVGVAAPFIPPTVREMLMTCAPFAISCGVVGAAPWPILIACLAGLALASYAVWSEPGSQKSSSAEPKPIANHLKTFSAALALVATTLFIWLHYDLSAREFKDAIDNAAATAQARAAGRLIIVDIVDGPSEALTIFIGLVVTSAIGAASFKGSIRWPMLLWPFVLGLISFPLMGALDSIGSFGWAYRNFAERYVWFVLFAVCCAGWVTAQLATSDIRIFSRFDRN